MPLVIVNPAPKRTAPKAKRKSSTQPAAQAAKGTAMAKRHRSAAQKAATRKMLAANRRRNPSAAPRRAVRRRTFRNPSPVRHLRRHRNPSTRGGSLMNELLSKEGLLSIGAIVAMPTLQTLVVGYVMPSATGYTKVALKTGIGLAIGAAVAKFLSRRAGMVAMMVAAGQGVAEGIQQWQAGAVLAAPASQAALSGLMAPGGRLSGYAPSMGGYAVRPRDPGTVIL